MQQANKNVIELFISAGVATAPNFLEEFQAELVQRISSAGATVRSELLYPYGDWSRPVTAQLREIAHDLRKGTKRIRSSIGGTRALFEIKERSFDRIYRGSHTKKVLIGHSAGGVASVHAAKLLLERLGGKPSSVVMIGAPKCRIPSTLRRFVHYVHGKVGVEKRSATLLRPDPVTRIGTFGGWVRGDKRPPIWDKRESAPASTIELPIIGKHADYFRSHAPYVNEYGQSNLDVTVAAVWGWLEHELISEGVLS